MDHMNFGDKAGVSLEKSRGLIDAFTPKGKFIVEHIRDGKTIGEYEFPNGITNEGINTNLGVFFHADAQITTWYLGLVDNAGFSAFASTDVMTSHAGWTESTAYSEATRQSWGPGAASGRSITNGTAVTFTMNATATIKGIFIVSDNTKGGTAGKLWSTAAFASTVSVNNGDLLKVTYTVSA